MGADESLPPEGVRVDVCRPGHGSLRLLPWAGRRHASRHVDGFRGVLVADFYAAYDTLNCPQQKYIVHLIRDVNDELAKYPFDEELKGLAARFGGLVRAAVETIDQHGLRRNFLRRHKPAMAEFYAREATAVYRSEAARRVQQRLLRNRTKLFTFLDHDGVAWNNNNAENAVKRFVTRRKGMEGTAAYGAAGLQQYLLLLSLYQTCRYRQINFWAFLKSGLTDLATFASRSR